MTNNEEIPLHEAIIKAMGEACRQYRGPEDDGPFEFTVTILANLLMVGHLPENGPLLIVRGGVKALMQTYPHFLKALEDHSGDLVRKLFEESSQS